MKKVFSYLFTNLILTFTLVNFCFADISFTEHLLVNNGDRYPCVYATDMDGDNDIDVIGCIWGSNEIFWLENDGNQNFSEHLVTDNVTFVHWVHAIDLDGDDDVDILGAAYGSGEIAWWENDGNLNFTKYVIGAGFAGATSVYAEDVDNDGDVDVLGAAENANDIRWWENDGNQNFTWHSIAYTNFGGASHVYATDVDNDGDIDVLGAARFDNEIAWWENDGNQNFNHYTIESNFDATMSVYATDLDGDDDVDVIGAAYEINQIKWWENDGNQNFHGHTISSNFSGVRTIYAADMDNDNDVDILGAAYGSNCIAWWENDGQQNYSQHLIAIGFTGAHTIFTSDLDNDGDVDILASAWSDDGIKWWENDLYRFNFQVEPSSGHAPLTVQFSDVSVCDQEITSRAWDFDNDGTIDSEEQNPTWTYNEPGVYSVRLDVSTASGSNSMVRENLIHVFDGKSALLFNSENSIASCPAAPGLNFVDKFTIEAWINPVTWGELGYGQIIDKNHISLYLINKHPLYPDSSLALKIVHANGKKSRSITPVNSITLNEWQHIAVSFDTAAVVKMYINGIEQEVEQRTAPYDSIADNSADDLIIGNSPDLDVTFDGIIDEVRIWNIVRTAEEIQANINTYLLGDEPGLAAYWRMDEGSGETILDRSANGNDGTVIDALWREGVLLNYPTAVDKTASQVTRPQKYRLYANYPNPFNPHTSIQFELPQAVQIKLKVYDVTGKLVTTLVNGIKGSGIHVVEWGGIDSSGLKVSSGVYFYKIEAKDFCGSKKMLLLK